MSDENKKPHAVQIKRRAVHCSHQTSFMLRKTCQRWAAYRVGTRFYCHQHAAFQGAL